METLPLADPGRGDARDGPRPSPGSKISFSLYFAAPTFTIGAPSSRKIMDAPLVAANVTKNVSTDV